jgi:2-keto-4-pentenoate hydratase/2-oxohepta-3-ene-1,7-dioic acid hydratase in catechol pathway
MSTEIVNGTANGTRPFQLAAAQVDGKPNVVIVLGSLVYCLRDLLPLGATAPDHLDDLFADWPRWHPVVTAVVGNASPRASAVQPERWLVPVRPAKLICVGVNYYDHLREMGGARAPDFPYCFFKPGSTGLMSSGSPVSLPIGPKMVDWEAELAVVMGSQLHHGKGPAVFDAVAGYTVYNDLSARDWIAATREPGIDWVMMKAYDGFSPIGPLITPREFVSDPQDLAIRCWVNGELKQDSNTSQMVFGVQAILEHLSGIMTLEPGDVIATGTPAGVGFGAEPQQFLGAGDTVVVEIDGLGRLETLIVKPSNGALT